MCTDDLDEVQVLIQPNKKILTYSCIYGVGYITWDKLPVKIPGYPIWSLSSLVYSWYMVQYILKWI